MSLPVRGEEYIFTIPLVDNANPEDFIANPTIAAGDFQISIDDGAFSNLNTLPTVEPSGDITVKITLSTTETDGDKITVKGVDQTSTKEWQDVSIFIDMPDANTETLFDVAEGDRTETSTRMTIKRKDTETVLIDKVISGSLLDTTVTLRTTEPS